MFNLTLSRMGFFLECKKIAMNDAHEWQLTTPARINGSEIHLEIPRARWKDNGKWNEEKNEIIWESGIIWKLITFEGTPHPGYRGLNCMESLENLIQRGMSYPQILQKMKRHGCTLK